MRYHSAIHPVPAPSATPLLEEEFDIDAYLMEPDQMLESLSPYHHIAHHHFTGETDE